MWECRWEEACSNQGGARFVVTVLRGAEEAVQLSPPWPTPWLLCMQVSAAHPVPGTQGEATEWCDFIFMWVPLQLIQSRTNNFRGWELSNTTLLYYPLPSPTLLHSAVHCAPPTDTGYPACDHSCLSCLCPPPHSAPSVWMGCENWAFLAHRNRVPHLMEKRAVHTWRSQWCPRALQRDLRKVAWTRDFLRPCLGGRDGWVEKFCWYR